MKTTVHIVHHHETTSAGKPFHCGTDVTYCGIRIDSGLDDRRIAVSPAAIARAFVPPAKGEKRIWGMADVCEDCLKTLPSNLKPYAGENTEVVRSEK